MPHCIGLTTPQDVKSRKLTTTLLMHEDDHNQSRATAVGQMTTGGQIAGVSAYKEGYVINGATLAKTISPFIVVITQN